MFCFGELTYKVIIYNFLILNYWVIKDLHDKRLEFSQDSKMAKILLSEITLSKYATLNITN